MVLSCVVEEDIMKINLDSVVSVVVFNFIINFSVVNQVIGYLSDRYVFINIVKEKIEGVSFDMNSYR